VDISLLRNLFTTIYIYIYIYIAISLKGDFNFVIPCHLLKSLNKSTKALSQYSISAQQCKISHYRTRSGSPGFTKNIYFNTVFINRGHQLTLYHNIRKTGLMLHYTCPNHLIPPHRTESSR
jgi:hypothetical protein